LQNCQWHLQWEGIEVTERSFNAVLNEPSVKLEVVVERSVLKDISNQSLQSGWLNEIHNPTATMPLYEPERLLMPPASPGFTPSVSTLFHTTTSLQSNQATSSSGFLSIEQASNIPHSSTPLQPAVHASPASYAPPQAHDKVFNFPLLCSICSFTTKRWRLMENHLKIHGKSAQIKCELCNSKFKSVFGFKKHSESCRVSEKAEVSNENVENSITDTIEEKNEPFNHIDLPLLALKLKGEHRVSDVALDSIFTALTNVFEAKNIELNSNFLSEQCKQLSSSYGRKKNFKSNLSLIEPVMIEKNKMVGYFLPFEDLLQFIFQSPEMRSFVNDERQQRYPMIDIFDGLHFTHVNLKNSLDLILYADDIGITNPIGKARSVHKICCIYFSIANIPSKYRSKSISVFPLALTYAKYMKDSDFIELLLFDFKKFLSTYSTKMFELNVQGCGLKFSAKLLAFLGDSLACNLLGGFKVGFSKNVLRCCRSCNSTRQQMEQFNTEVDSLLRTETEHNYRISDLNKNSLPKYKRVLWSKRYGISHSSILSSIPNFSVTKQILFDPMHDLFEGIVPLQIELVLKYYQTTHNVEIADFNNFFETQELLRNMEKPPVLSDNFSIIGRLGSGQNLTVLRYLPIFVNSFNFEIDEHWNCFILLCQIVQLILSPIVDSHYIQHLQVTIEKYLNLFKQLYPESFIPKLHFLVHYPSQAKFFGPLRNHTCLAFERKHQIIKRVRYYNFKNILLSSMNYLVWNLTAHFHADSTSFKENIFIDVPEIKYNHEDAIQMIINGIFYEKGMIIYNNKKFCEILSLRHFNSKWFLQTVELESTYSFKLNSFSYIQTNNVEMLNPDLLDFPWPAIKFSSCNKQYFEPLALSNLML